ncbi:MFS transporter [Erysipelothrix urinaevulpis]|uniref:MFS transporter n=1 Tax=Erysipelothrix urinaevulpis TaxID=2683717 RepID=UPI0013574CDB|nr:MFS transporter [Erysipelothrix urinaevulpis]
MNNREKKITVFSLFFNYILQGMAAIILSQHLKELMVQLQTDAKGVSLVISCIGLGRVLVLYLSGYLSDRLGRKPIILIGMISYLIFFTGIMFSHLIYLAAFFALFAGFANAFLDTGTYPAIAEIYPNFSCSVSVFNKAFISIGQFILPYIVGFLLIEDLYYGYTFVMCILLLLINLIVMWRCKFPELNPKQNVINKIDTHLKRDSKLEGVALVTLGFTIVTLFNIIAWWMPEYAMQVVNMERAEALKLVSLYSLGSFISVFITAYVSKKTRCDHWILWVCSSISVVLLTLIILIPSVLFIKVATFFIGVFAAGGIWQIALAIMIDFYPHFKGRVTSVYTMATSISVMLIPYITGVLANRNIKLVMYFNLMVGIINLIAATIVVRRYKQS